MSKTTNAMMFVLGAAVGSMVTWQYTKRKYEQIAQEEIDSVKSAYTKREVKSQVEIEKQVAEGGDDSLKYVKEKPGVLEYAAQLQKEGYINYSSSISSGNEAEENGPYIISPEEFGEFEEYEKISLTYYSDQVVADENDEVIDDVEGVIGFESLTHFGEYEDDSVFVRNDRLQSDYEILMDQRLYSDIISTMPHRVEGQ